VGAGEHPLELEGGELALDGPGVLGGLGARGVVRRLLGELGERLGVVERAPDLVVGPGDELEARLLLQERLGPGVVGPEGRRLGEPRDLLDAAALPLDVKATPGAPPGGASARRGVPA
jgi:hypothetical protein